MRKGIYLMFNRKLRVVAVFAMVVGMLVPAATASAGDPKFEANPDFCDGIFYNAANPAHHMMGAVGAGWIVVDGYMFIDLSGAPGPQVVFWNGEFAFGTDGVWVIGSDFGDTICGTSGDDLLYGKKGPDRIFTGFGDDNYHPVTAPDEGDQAFGGAGHDLIFNGYSDTKAVGSPNDALLAGGKGNDELFAGGKGWDVLRGNAGDDYLDVYPDFQNGTMFGGAGNDTLKGGRSMYGKSGDDHVWFRAGLSTGYGGSGNDMFHFFGGNNEAYGHKGNDVFLFEASLTGADGDKAYGGPGNDTFQNMGSGDNQEAYGGSGNDTFTPFDSSTDPGVQTPYGFEAWGERGNDSIFGGEQSDHLVGGGDNDLIEGGDGADVIEGMTGDDFIDGGAHGDWLFGGTGNDTMLGGSGDDWMFGGAPSDNPWLDGSEFDCPASAFFTWTVYRTTTPVGLETAGDYADCPLSGDGDDQMWGGAGADWINGGTGSNVMYANAPFGNVSGNMDVSDGVIDNMYAFSSDGVGTGSDPASFNTYYGSCGVPGDAYYGGDHAYDGGDGIGDTAFNTAIFLGQDGPFGPDANIEVWQSPCKYFENGTDDS